MNKLLMVIAAVLLTAACSSSDGKLGAGPDLKITNCLRGFEYDYEKLLTIDDVKKHLQVDETSLKKDVSPTNGSYGSCKYKWSSDRPELEMELLGQTIRYPDDNIVEIKWLSFYAQNDLETYNQQSVNDLFDIGYKKLTEAELARMKENVEKQFANDEKALENALNLLEIRKNSAYQPVENLGDRAYWKWNDRYGVEVVVLTGLASFTIAGKTSNNPQEGLNTAIRLAEEVLAKCKN